MKKTVKIKLSTKKDVTDGPGKSPDLIKHAHPGKNLLTAKEVLITIHRGGPCGIKRKSTPCGKALRGKLCKAKSVNLKKSDIWKIS